MARRDKMCDLNVTMGGLRFLAVERVKKPLDDRSFN